MAVEFPIGTESSDIFGGCVKDVQPFADANIDFSNFLNLDELNDSILTSNQGVSWNSTFDPEFFGDLNFDVNNNMDAATTNSLSLGLNDVPLFVNSVDPPMFELPACGS